MVLIKKMFFFSLYINSKNAEKEPSWYWIIKEFKESYEFHTYSQPRAILLIQHSKECYIATFGNSFYLADKYCDKNFAFSVARRLEIKDKNTISKLNERLQKNISIEGKIIISELSIVGVNEIFAMYGLME